MLHFRLSLAQCLLKHPSRYMHLYQLLTEHNVCTWSEPPGFMIFFKTNILFIFHCSDLVIPCFPTGFTKGPSTETNKVHFGAPV